MKNFAKLVLFFSCSFIGILILANLLAFLQDWTREILLFPFSVGVFTWNLAENPVTALVVAFYLAILLSLNYAIRHKIRYPLAFLVILLMSVALSCAAFFGLGNLKLAGGFTITGKKPAELSVNPGLILNHGKTGTQTLFMEDPAKPEGVKVVSSPGSPLSLQNTPSSPARNEVPLRMQLPFFLDGPITRIFGSLDHDFGQSARKFSASFYHGFLPFGIYAGSLAIFLLSLGCLINISYWPLANLFFGALAFRGALALEAFFNQPDIHNLLASFAGKFVGESMIIPMIFCTLSALILLYSGLVYLAKGRDSDD